MWWLELIGVGAALDAAGNASEASRKIEQLKSGDKSALSDTLCARCKNCKTFKLFDANNELVDCSATEEGAYGNMDVIGDTAPRIVCHEFEDIFKKDAKKKR